MEASGTTRTDALRRAGAWLAHPVSVLALVVMVVNDHLLKQAHGTWWTGKLSDAAGLVFFPALVALVLAWAAPRLAWRTVVATALGATAVGFTWVKATSTGAATASDLLTAVAGPSLVREDLTDLLALPFLAIAAASAARPATRGAWRVAVVLPVAVLATAATSQDTSICGVVSVREVDGQVAVGTGDLSNADPRPYQWWIGDGGDQFAPVDEADFAALETRLDQDPEPSAIQCLEWSPAVCYRPYAGNLGVERSTDGGTTWVVDWEVLGVQREALAESVETYGQYEPGDLGFIETYEVAVAGDATAYYVYAANGTDGVAMRHPDGAWERIGYPGYSDWHPAQPLPATFDPSEHQGDYARGHVAPMALVIASLVVSAAFALTGGGRRSARTLWSIATLLGVVTLLVGWASAATYVDVLAQRAEIEVPSLAPLYAWAILSGLLAAICMLVARPLLALAGIAGSLAIATAAAFVAGWTDAAFPTQVWVGIALALALSIPAAFAFRARIRAVPTQPKTPQAPPPYSLVDVAALKDPASDPFLTDR